MKKIKIAINNCYGGFSLSPEGVWWLYDAQSELIELIPVEEYWGNSFSNKYSGIDRRASLERWREYLLNPNNPERSRTFITVFTEDEKYVILDEVRDQENRAHPDLIACIEALGKMANGAHAAIKIKEIPDNVDWQIEEYDGLEHIAEKHRTW